MTEVKLGESMGLNSALKLLAALGTCQTRLKLIAVFWWLASVTDGSCDGSALFVGTTESATLSVP